MNKCIICNEEIKNDSQYINGNWYHNLCICNLTETLQEKGKEISHLRENKERTLDYIENNKIREKCIVDVNTLEGLLNE